MLKVFNAVFFNSPLAITVTFSNTEKSGSFEIKAIETSHDITEHLANAMTLETENVLLFIQATDVKKISRGFFAILNDNHYQVVRVVINEGMGEVQLCPA